MSKACIHYSFREGPRQVAELPVGSTTFDFATTVLGMSVKEFGRVLPIFRQIQTIVDHLDVEGEKVSPSRAIVIGCWNALEQFLKSHNLWFDSVKKCIDGMKQYAEFEWKLHEHYCLADQEILKALDLKPSDLILMRSVVTEISGKKVSASTTDLFHLIEVLREIFDDIIDYDEDASQINFNIVRLLVKNHGLHGGVEQVSKLIIAKYDQIVNVAHLSWPQDNLHQGGILTKINEEKIHHLELLRMLETRMGDSLAP